MKYCSSIFFLFLTVICLGQGLTTEKVYNINPWTSGAIIIGGSITNTLGRTFILQQKDPIPISTLNQLSRNDVWSFDRIGLDQNIEQREDWEKLSDLGLTGSNILPILLFLDKSIAKDWKEILVLYLETQVISSNVFTNIPFGSILVDKFRPRTYYPELPLAEREGGNNKNSFFSGHTSITASASFFMAKVYSDYHPEMKGKIWLFGAALIPPAFVGLSRVKGLYHFPSDVVVGTIVGAAVGILVPQLHKNNSKVNMSLFQFNDATGLALKIKM